MDSLYVKTFTLYTEYWDSQEDTIIQGMVRPHGSSSIRVLKREIRTWYRDRDEIVLVGD